MWFASQTTRMALLLLSCGAVLTAAAPAGNVPTTRPAKPTTFRRPAGVPAVTPALGRPTAAPAGGVVRPAPSAPIVTSGNAAPKRAKSDDEKEILVIQALDQPATLKIQDVPIAEAVRMLSENTGVPIEFDRFVLGCLPYGTETRITATIQNQPLRESLTALLKPLACKFVLDRDKIVLQPRPALFRICRRATWEEVGLIEKLYATTWSQKLGDTLQFQFQDMSSADSEANRKKIYQLAASVGAGNAARVLDLACEQYSWAWHPEANAISICTKARQMELQMQRRVSGQYSEMQIKEVLLDLAQRAGMLLKMEPGVLSSLPTHQLERFRMTLENESIHQAFELVTGETGLAYRIEPDGIRITASAKNTATSPAPAFSPDPSGATKTVSANPVVGTIPIPGVPGGHWFVRESDLPPAVSRMRPEQIKKAFEPLLAASSQPSEETRADAK